MKSNDSVALTTLPAKAFSSRESILLLLLKLRTFIALILIVGFFAITVPDFLATGSLVIMVKHIAINAFLALGITFVIITAGIDLSIGATLGLCGMIAGWLITKGIVLPMFGIAIFPSVWVIVPVVLLIGALIGAGNGWIITRYNVAPFICTLGTMYILRGAAMLTSGGATISSRGSAAVMASRRNAFKCPKSPSASRNNSGGGSTGRSRSAFKN